MQIKDLEKITHHGISHSGTTRWGQVYMYTSSPEKGKAALADLLEYKKHLLTFPEVLKVKIRTIDPCSYVLTYEEKND